MGINIDQAAIIDDEELEVGVVTAEEIEGRLFEKGLQRPKKPSGHPVSLTEVDVNVLTNDELAALYTQYVGYQSFLSVEVAIAKVYKHASASNLKTVVAKLKTAFHAKGVKEKEILERVRLHPKYIEYDAEAARARYMCEITEAYDRSYGKQAQALSRCVELRKLEMERLKRDNNIGSPSFGKSGKITRPHRRKPGLPSVKKKGARSDD